MRLQWTPTERCLTWLLVTGLGVLNGIALGHILDEALWQISFDYLHGAGEFLAKGGRAGGLAGSLLACALTVGSLGRLPRAVIIRRWAELNVGIVLVGLAFAVTAAATATAEQPGIPEEQLAQIVPPRRHAFCMALIHGVTFGFWMMTGLEFLAIVRGRFHTRVVERSPA